MQFKKVDDIVLERAYTNGFDIYKVPGISQNESGTMFCYYEGRNEEEKKGNKALFYRTSKDGINWSPRFIIAEGNVVHNVSILGGHNNEAHMFWCEGYNSCYYKKSIDGGQTWGYTVSLKGWFESFKSTYAWNYYAISNGHGLILENGRILLTAWMSSGRGCHKPACLISLYSDDNGYSWNLGDFKNSSTILPDPTECSFVQFKGGKIMATIRHNNKNHYRGFAFSNNGGTSWEGEYLDFRIPDPICSAGLACISNKNEEYLILSSCDYFTDCDGPSQNSRQNLTIRVSRDRGDNWESELLVAKLGGYSDLMYDKQRKLLYCFYESEWDENQCFKTKKLSLSIYCMI